MNDSWRLKILFITVSTGLLLATLGCGQMATNSANLTSPASNQAAATQTPVAVQITPADLKKLRWIEGSWRGTGDIDRPFYERYRFENDSTLVMEELADETLSEVKSTTRYELKNGQFGNDRSVATALDDKGITFSPLVENRNSFRWQTESKDVWKAILTMPVKGSTPAKERVYKLERWPAK
jgi:hypothetical protein